MNTRVYNHYPTGGTPRYRGIPALQIVKNLGWLLRHSAEVKHICIQRRENGTATLSADGIRVMRPSNTFIHYTFTTTFASFNIACKWVKRPRFAHLSDEQVSILR